VGCTFGRRQRDLLVQLREAQAGLAQRAQAEERNRIAREMHDVIAHTLTVSLLHVSSARLALADDPDEAARALAEAERLGRESLEEVRHAVGLMRGPTDRMRPLPAVATSPAWSSNSVAPVSTCACTWTATSVRCRPPSGWPPTGSCKRASPTPRSMHRRPPARYMSPSPTRPCK